MKTFTVVLLVILGLILLALLLLLFTKIRIFAEFSKRKEQKLKANVSISLLGGIIKRDLPLESPKIKKTKSADNPPKKEDELKFFEKVKKYYRTFLDFKYIYNKNSRKIRCAIHAERIEFDLKFGAGDAAATGIMTGALWAGIYDVIAFVAGIIRITEPQITVTPLYNELSCEFEGKCIISTRVANLILAVVSIGISYLKIKNKKEKAAI